MPLEVGSIVEGRVTGITRFGAFVELEEGQTGLVHISEIANVYVEKVEDFVKENERVKVKILNVAPGKIGLSIRQANPNAGPAREMHASHGRGGRSSLPQSFEDKLSRFLKDSEEKQLDLRRSLDSKRRGRGMRS